MIDIDMTPNNFYTDTPPRLAPLDWAAIWDTATEGEDWLIKPLIGRGRLVSLYSPPGIGKSLLALELSAALASGGMALGNHFEPTRVLYVDHENDPRGDVVSRLRDMGYSPRHVENLAYYSFPAMHTLDTEIGGRQLLELAQLHGAELVVIDTVSRTIAGEENENGTWLDLYRHTCRLLKAESIACLRLDHAGKDITKGLRGGSAKTGDVDMVWLLAKQSADVFTLTCEKHRHHLADEDSTITLRRMADPLRHDVAALPRQAAQTARVSTLVARLDELNVPVDSGRPKAGQVLQDNAVKFSNSDLSEALKERRKLSEELHGQVQTLVQNEMHGQHRTGTP